MKKFRHAMRIHRALIVGIACIVSLMYLLAISSRGKLITQEFFDPIRTTDMRDEIVIVGIDDKSLQTVGAWPWGRSIFSDVTKKLDSYGAKAVVYDVLFLESRKGDDIFKKTLADIRTPVVFAAKVEKKKENEIYLESFFVNTTSTVTFPALANIQPDTDGKVRRYPDSYIHNSRCISPLAVEAFRIITHTQSSPCTDYNDSTFRYPSDIPVYSLIDVMHGEIDTQKLKGKIVFIGSTSLDLEDHFVGLGGEKVPGVYVHASILTSLLHKEADKECTHTEIAFLLLASTLLTLLLLYYTKTIRGQLGVLITVAIAALSVSFLLFEQHTIIPAPWIIASILLSSGYNTIIRFIQEKKRGEHISSLFSKYVHKDVLHELMKSPESLNLKGEKKELTVLFSDLRGFTSLSESLSPEELTKILNGYFSAMTPSILEEHGTIDKFIGDAIMAFWNAPLEVNHHERHAVLSALRMQEALRDFNMQHATTLAVGVGIHTGHAVVGNVGSQERVNYTVLGDTVNLASRVESLTKKYGVEILVTEEVKNKVDDTGIIFRKLDIITVKGKTEPTVLYEVMRDYDVKAKFVEEYEEAFLLYQRGDFEKARVLFKTLSGKGDTASEKMYERLSSLSNIENWDGIWHFDEK